MGETSDVTDGSALNGQNHFKGRFLRRRPHLNKFIKSHNKSITTPASLSMSRGLGVRRAWGVVACLEICQYIYDECEHRSVVVCDYARA